MLASVFQQLQGNAIFIETRKDIISSILITLRLASDLIANVIIKYKNLGYYNKL